MEKPSVVELENGVKGWEKIFEHFRVTVVVPETKQPADIVNFGFRAPYLMIFAQKYMNLKEASEYAEQTGLSRIAADFGGSVTFFYPMNEGGWKEAPKELYREILSQSRISQYYQDGYATMYDRFAKKMGDSYIRGAVLRTYLYGIGEAADYIAMNCLRTIEGDGLYGPGDVTPAGCILEKLSIVPDPERRDIPVLSIGNSDEINQALQEKLDYFREKELADYVDDYYSFVDRHRRMVGNLEEEADLKAMGMCFEPDWAEVTTSPDNRGDDRDTKRHRIGYVAYYNAHIFREGRKAPLVLCFHGGGDSAICMATISGWYKVAHDHDFLLVSVENHLNSTATETMELLEILKTRYAIDEHRIYASGFSMGGCKSWDMCQEYPEVFAALAPMDATFEVGYNAAGEKAQAFNTEVPVPIFYAGGEITPLPELPFQAQKCVDRMAYVLKLNHAKREYHVDFNRQEEWENKIFGISGDHVEQLPNPERPGSVLTLHSFESMDGVVRSVFACVGGQGHEVRHHTCEQAWRFMSRFSR